jgi:ATP adenylyltransferase
MKRLYAPWRAPYSADTHRHTKPSMSATQCVFCLQFKQKKDSENFIITRTKYNAIILNRFPYNAGHLLILPLKHQAALEKLSKPIQQDLMQLLSESVVIMKEALGAEGINIGLNLGKAAGAGLPSHLHFHVLPRWSGDTNFLPLLAETKQISFDLHKIYEQLKKAFKC